jgi:Tol biopolymer transport system component
MQRLSPEGFAVVFPKWSADGRFIAASTITEGEPTNVYLIPTVGGAPLKLLPGEINVRDPDWSPDGKTIVVVHAPAGGEDALFLVDFATRTESPLPQSRGKFLPHWSPDGRHIAAYSADGQGVEVYDFATSAWQSVASGKGLGFPSWSQDGRFLYYQRLLDQDEPVYRVDLKSHMTTRVVDFKAELGSGIWRCALMGLSPDGKLLVEFNRGFNDLYRAELSLPK